MDSPRRSARLVPMVLPILLRAPQSGRLTADWALARCSAPCGAIEKALQTSRSQLPSPTAAGAPALGLRFAKDLIKEQRTIPSLDASALLHKIDVCIQALTKRKPILLPVRQGHWPQQQLRGAIPPRATCRSKFFSVASATPTSILSATNGASSWRRSIQSFPAMRSSAV